MALFICDISWEKTGEAALEGYNKGDQIKAKILEIDLEKERISLGIKQLSDDPYVGEIEKVQKGSVVTCTITAIADGGLGPCWRSSEWFHPVKQICRVNAVSREPERFAVDEKIDAVVTQFDKKHATFHCQSKRVKSLKRSGQWLIMGHQTAVQALEISLALHWRKKMMAARLTQTVR